MRNSGGARAWWQAEVFGLMLPSPGNLNPLSDMKVNAFFSQARLLWFGLNLSDRNDFFTINFSSILFADGVCFRDRRSGNEIQRHSVRLRDLENTFARGFL